MFISKTIKTDVVTITPKMAEKLLGKNIRNRNVSPGNYNKLCEALRNGEWELNGEAIKIGNDGSILDGQHRLMACRDTGVPFQTLIVYGLDTGAADTMDQGKSRSIANVLALHKYPSPTHVASLVSGIIKMEKGGIRQGVHNSSNVAVTANQVVERLEKEPELVEIMRFGQSMRPSGLSAKVSGVLYYKFSQIDQEDADDFFAKLRDGAGLERGNPILALREKLISMKSETNRRSSAILMAALTIKAWNAYRHGETVKLLRWTAGGASPEKFPEPV